MLQLGFFLLSSSRYNWLQRAWSVTLFEKLVLWASCFALLYKAVKLSYWGTTNSSILQDHKMCVMVILAQNRWSDLNPCLIELMLDNTTPISRLWWLSVNYLVEFLLFWSIHIKTMSYNGYGNKGFVTTGVNQTNRPLSHKVWLISCLDLPNTWAPMNYSTNMCQSDTCFFITLKQQGQDLKPLELPYLHFTGTPLSLLHRWSGWHLSQHTHSQG